MEKLFEMQVPDYSKFGDVFPDGRLVSEPDGKKYRLREALIKVRKLGRPLTDDEMKEFEITNINSCPNL